MIIPMIFFIASLVLLFEETGKVRKEKDFHRDFTLQKFNFEPRTTISTYPESLARNWRLVANMQRWFKVSLSDRMGYSYLLTTKGYAESEAIKKSYVRVHPPHPSKFLVFKKIKIHGNQT